MNLLKTENNFDILRLILAILVFFAHWNILTSQNISNPFFHLSGFAVDMFFIVSGFLIFDLFTVCEMITNPKISLNRLVELLRGELEFEKLLEIVRFKDFTLPDFYEQEREVFQNVKEKIKEDEFREFLNKKIEREGELGLKILQKDIGYIKTFYVDKDNRELLNEFGGMLGLINGRLII